MFFMNTPKYKRILLKLSGEALAPAEGGSILDFDFIAKVAKQIKRCTDDNLDIDFHYCPLVKSWQKQGCSDEEICMLCDHAMCGDRGIAESFGCELELPKTIAKGDGVCEIRFVRKK